MKKKLIKIFMFMLLIIFLLNIFTVKVFSAGDTSQEQDYDWVSGAQTFIDAGNGGEVGINGEKLKSASDDIFNVFSSIGMIISVVVGIVLGIIYMMSSAVDKAKVKESLIPYLIGSFVIFGAFGIWKLVINTFNGI